jgi:hypothetical protein
LSSTAWVEAAFVLSFVLSVVVRSGPVVTAGNGTLVARLARMTWHTLAPSVHRDRRVRPVLGDYCLVGKP